MNIDRLNHLCDVLDRVDPVHFSLEDWAHPSCGTTACAVGHAALDAQFNAAGFRLAVSEKPLFRQKHARFCRTLADIQPSRFVEHRHAYPCYGRYSGWDAVCKFFGLTKEQAKWLFRPGSYPEPAESTPAGVAARIRGMLGKKWAPTLEPEVVAALAT
jgi:hypothetical protein